MFNVDKAHAASVPALIALAAAGLGACFLQLAAWGSVEGLVEPLWITAWILVVCAVGAGLTAGALLWRRRGLTAPSAVVSIALVLATVATLVLVWLWFPPFGAGGGAA